MKVFRSLAVLLFIFSLSIFGKAQAVDFKFQVLDPIGPGPALGDSFMFSSVCPSEVTDFAMADNTALYGCYIATNDTDATITSIDLSFMDTDALDSQTPNCLNSGSDDLNPAFGMSSCSESDGIYDLFYSGGTGLAPGATVAIAEYEAAAADFPTVYVTVTETPEPNSILLLSTGVLCVGIMLFRRRANLLSH